MAGPFVPRVPAFTLDLVTLRGSEAGKAVGVIASGLPFIVAHHLPEQISQSVRNVCAFGVLPFIDDHCSRQDGDLFEILYKFFAASVNEKAPISCRVPEGTVHQYDSFPHCGILRRKFHLTPLNVSCAEKGADGVSISGACSFHGIA
jgi:hypothetical protein